MISLTRRGANPAAVGPQVVNIKGNSYRLREYRRRKEVLEAAATIAPAPTVA